MGKYYNKEKFNSEYHEIGNYLVKFNRYCNERGYLFSIEFFTVEKIKVSEIRMDFNSACELFKLLYQCFFGNYEIHYALPLYNLYEHVVVDATYNPPFADRSTEYSVNISKENIMEKSETFSFPINDINDAEDFLYLYEFFLLSDIIDYDWYQDVLESI